MRALPREFYAQDTVTVAKKLLGKELVRRIGGNTVSGTIIETEAYKHRDDPASHAFNGMTERNRAMFGEVGRAYVYFTYGMHHCVNAVARSRKSMAGAVLIRAIRPTRGIEHMIRNRGNGRAGGLTDGPAKLAQALRIDRGQYGADLSEKGGPLFIAEGTPAAAADASVKGTGIRASARVGISKAVDRKWNFRITG